MHDQSKLVTLLNTAFDARTTKRILEIRFPILLYLLIEEPNHSCLIGQSGLPGGHFQVGKFNAIRKEWTPASEQDGLRWETLEERDCILHQIQRVHGLDKEIAFIQHTPLYRQRHGIQTVESIDEVNVTPLWDAKLGYRTFHCTLTLPCGCSIYQSLSETRNYHWR